MTLRDLRKEIADTIDKFASDSRNTRAKRVSNIAELYAREMVSEAWRLIKQNPLVEYSDLEKQLQAAKLFSANLSKDSSVARLLIESFVSTKDTVLIDSHKLIQSYDEFEVTNWFNCSVADFNGKIYMAYRMDMQPWATHMRIGICELDAQTLQPINVSETPLYIQSNYDVGTHVEDPRLFIHNHRLHLSYTDGYQMGQTRINTMMMNAEESFYLRKPTKMVTEKNWVFFSHEGELYCIYSTTPYKIFKMDGSRFEKVVLETFPLHWGFGNISGGASPIRHGDYYYHFFHSALPFESPMLRRQYFMGCYLFEAKFPFKPVAITKIPLLAGEFCDPSIKRLSNEIYVVFPGGAYIRDGMWSISFGNNDYECRVLQMTDELLKTLLT